MTSEMMTAGALAQVATGIRHLNPWTDMQWPERCRGAADTIEAQAAEIERLKAERDKAQRRASNLQLQAQIWAGESDCHKSTVHECYQAVTGATGEPGNWNGAVPVRKALAERDETIASLREALRVAGEWQPIETAPKDRTSVLLLLKTPIPMEGRDDLRRWDGLQFVGRHPGLANDGFDMGWGFAAPVGHGGFPDDWMVGWRPLPAPPACKDSLQAAATGEAPTRHGDLNAAVREFEAKLPGWWWSLGWCNVSSDASCAPDRAGLDAHLLEHRHFDEGFHADLRDGNLVDALRNVAEQALAAKQAMPTGEGGASHG